MPVVKRIITGIFSVVIIFSLSFNVFAADAEYTSNPSFWEYQLYRFLDSAAEASDTWLGTALQDHDIPGRVASSVSEDICASSSDGLHHCHVEDLKLDGLTNLDGVTACMATCEYCGEEFLVTGDDLGDAYAESLEDMETDLGSVVLTDGGLILPLYMVTGPATPNGSSSYPSVVSRSYGYPFAVVAYTSTSISQLFWFYATVDSGSVNIPFSFYGTIYAADILCSNITGLSDGIIKSRSFYLSGYHQFYVQLTGASTADSVYSISGRVYVLIEPIDTEIINSYDYSTRIGTITGDVVVIGDNNETTVYNDCQFVDETNNQYYNPTTNTWNTYNSYSYDYSTFTYNFKTDSGNTTINYGDEYITITEVAGDTTNNYYYYYYVEDSGSGDDDTCDHVYTSEVTREPSCTMTGITTYTCTKCGNQYTTTIDALGHDWLLKDSVPTTYSVDTSAITCPDDGSTNFTYTLDEETETYTFTNTNTNYTWTVPATVTEGYDLYECSRCGETYRDYDGSGPPDDEDGLFAAIGDFLADAVSWILDKLSSLIDSISTINESFSSYIESLKDVGGEYPMFLSGIIAILPEDLINVFWFSAIAACAVLAYKKWFK